MKPLLAVTAVAVLLGVLMAATPDRAPDRYEHLVVSVPYALVVQLEFKDFGKVDKKIKKETPLDSLGEDGWELVDAVLVKNEAVCFLKRRKPGK